MMRTILLFVALVCGAFMYGQTQVSGVVVDQNNIPVPGANLLVEGTNEGAVTDFDGNFSLKTNVKPPFKLLVSSIGFSNTTVSVTSNNQKLKITLKEQQPN